MAIQHQTKVIERIIKVVNDTQKKYQTNVTASNELKKLQTCLEKLKSYLNDLDQLKPNYDTNSINRFVEEIELHMAILKGELDSKDYNKINNGIKVLKAIVKFHPIKYTYITFVIAWLYELLFFI